MEENPSTQAAARQPVRAPPAPRYNAAMVSLRSAGLFTSIGILLFFIGIILLQLVSFAGDYNLMRYLISFSLILSYVGVLMITLPLYLVGITNVGLDWKVRATMISSATAIIIATMIITLFSAGMTSATMASYYSMSNMVGGY